MKTQFDHPVRIVSLENLKALCDRASGHSHTYRVIKVSRSRVHVEYSNPDEYGNPRPIVAVFPCYPSTFDGAENPAIVLGDCTRIIGGSEEYDPIQSFDPIISGPVLYRSQGTASRDRWLTRAEIDGTTRYLCPDGKVRELAADHPYTNATFAAFDVTEETSAETFARIGGNRHFAFFTWSDLKPAK